MKHSFSKRIKLMCFFLFSLSITSFAQQLAFPGAEGFGRFSLGGRGGSVYHVTNLNDSGPGSFRDAVSQSYRTVVFDVSGVINISSRIVIQHHVTVAGQTAPGGGITIYGNGIALNGDSGDNIIRYIRIRMGVGGDSGKDAIGISEGQNYIFDHVSVSWGRDGNIDINGSGIDNTTIQECIIAQGLHSHSTGGLMQSGKASVIRSLYIDNHTRNPKGRGAQEYINNVIYNWRVAGYILGDTEGLSEANIMGNYFISGPSTSSSPFNSATSSFHTFADDNWYDPDQDGTLDGWALSETSANYGPVTFETSPYAYHITSGYMTGPQAYSYVVDNVGASLYRDDVDNLLIGQLTSFGTQGTIISNENENGISGNVGTIPSTTAPTDSDQDGMPDYWESANGLNSGQADNNGDQDSDGYTNLEEYLDWVIDNHQGVSIDAYSTIEAESFNSQSGVQNEACSEGGENVAFIEDGDWFAFNNIDFGTGADEITMRVATNGTGGTVKVRLGGTGGTEIGSISVSSTGGWQNWANETASISGASGIQDVYFVFEGGTGYLFNVNHFSFSQGTSSNGNIIEENTLGFCNVDGTVDSNNAGYTGTGFANTDNVSGEGVDWKLDFESSGQQSITFRYAGTSNRPANLLINGNVVQSNIDFPSTGSWTSWSTITISPTISAGIKDVRLEATSSSGLSNIDYISIEDADAASCIASSTYTIQESETGFCGVDGSIDSNNAGFTGSGFANTTNALNQGIQWVVDVPSNGTYELEWQFANGGSSNRAGSLIVNGNTITNVSLPTTGSWTTWVSSSSALVSLQAGTNTVELSATSSDGLANIDYMNVTGSNPSGGTCSGSRVSDVLKASISSELVQLYPNPVEDLLQVNLPEDWMQNKLSLFTISGKLISSHDFQENTFTLDVKTLSTGSYIVVIENNTGIYSHRIIKE